MKHHILVHHVIAFPLPTIGSPAQYIKIISKQLIDNEDLNNLLRK